MQINENLQVNEPDWEPWIDDLKDPSKAKNFSLFSEELGGSSSKKTTAAPTNFAPVLEPPAQLRTSDELLSMLLSIKTKLANEQISAAQDDVETAAIKQEQKHDEILEQINKSIEAGKKAKKGGVFGKIFGWIASAATAIAGAVMIATGVGAIAGAAMMALAVDSMVGMTTGHSMMGELTKGTAKLLESMGMGETAAYITAAIGVAAATIAATAGAGAASIARTGAGAGLVSRIASSSQQAQKFQSMGLQVKNVSLITSGTSEIGSGSAGITTGVYKKQATDARAEQMLTKKELAQLQAKIEVQEEWIRELVEKLNDGVSRIMQIMNKDHANRSTIVRNMI